MTDISNINNIAREIVSNLDKQDGKEDGKIEASIWNKFVCHKQGNEIHNYINTNSAVKSVLAYLKREVAKTGQAIEDVANEWLKNVGGGDKTEIDEKGKLDNDLSMSFIEADTPEEQERIDNANQLLSDVATSKYRYKIEKEKPSEDLTYITAKLADGRYIQVSYIGVNNPSLLGIAVSTKDKKGYVFYNAIGGCGSVKGNGINDINSESYEKGVINQYNKDDLLKIIQKIFGDDIEV